MGSVQLASGIAPRDSGLARLRELAGDAPGLAYELGRLDALGDSEFAADLIESALRRLSVLSSDNDVAS